MKTRAAFALVLLALAASAGAVTHPDKSHPCTPKRPCQSVPDGDHSVVLCLLGGGVIGLAMVKRLRESHK